MVNKTQYDQVSFKKKKKLNQTGIPELSPTLAGTLVPEML